MHICLLNCLTNSFKFLYNQYKKVNRFLLVLVMPHTLSRITLKHTDGGFQITALPLSPYDFLFVVSEAEHKSPMLF